MSRGEHMRALPIRFAVFIIAVTMASGGVARGGADNPPSGAFLEVRSDYPYPETMNRLQEGLQQAGFRILFIQPIDKGLTQVGAKPSGRYRVLVVEPAEGARGAALDHSTIEAALPLRITIQERVGGLVAEVSTLRPTALVDSPSTSTAATALLRSWEQALTAIFARLRP